VSWTCTDVDSGVDASASVLGDDVMIASGQTEASCTDLAGNTVNASLAVLIDKAAPVLTATPNPLPNADGWNNTDATVSWTCTDVDSGVDPAASALGDDVLAASGQTEASCTDHAGNTVNASHEVLIDRSAPGANPAQAPVANSNGWNSSDATVTWNWSDAGSGIDPGNCTTSSTSSGEGTLTLTASCTDIAGNTGTVSYVAKVDTTAPALTIAAPLDLSVQPTGLVLDFSATDAVSGVDTVSGRLSDGTASTVVQVQSGYVINVAGVYTLTVIATDRAGNTEALSHTVVVYDPSAGFVTGGGWINSPRGAYSADRSLAGKATFGFVSQYKVGKTVPTGDTRFQFRAAGRTSAVSPTIGSSSLAPGLSSKAPAPSTGAATTPSSSPPSTAPSAEATASIDSASGSGIASRGD